MTSQLPTAKWHDHLGDPTMADAICDRLLHNGAPNCAKRPLTTKGGLRHRQVTTQRRYAPIMMPIGVITMRRSRCSRWPESAFDG